MPISCSFAGVPFTFWNYVDKKSNSPCWVWFGSKNKKGYGNCNFNGKTTSVHKLVYSVSVGDVPVNHVIHHKCYNSSCVNPEHLMAVSNYDNCVTLRRKPSGPSKLESCKQGHKFENDNIYITPDGRRQCKICRRRRVKKYYANMER